MSGLGIALQLVHLTVWEGQPLLSSLLTVLCCGKSGIGWLPVWRLLLLADSMEERKQTHQSTWTQKEVNSTKTFILLTLGETKEGRGGGTGRK